MSSFQPSHVKRNDVQEVEYLDEVILLTEPFDCFVGILFRDQQGKKYVMNILRFEKNYECILSYQIKTLD
jgi:hypothetical protein